MFCANCGATVPEGVRFCENCGTPVKQAEQLQATVQTTVQTRVTESQTRKAPVEPAKRGVGRAIVSVLLCLLIILAGSYTDAVFLIRNAVNEDAVSSVVKEVNPAEVKVGFLEDDQNRTLAEYITDYANDNFFVGMEVEEAEELLDEKYIKKFITQKTNDYVNDILFETGDGVIEAKEIEELWLDNLDKINEATGAYMSEEQVLDAIGTLKDSNILDATDISVYREESPATFATIKNLLSNWILIIGMVLVCVLLICLFLVQDKKRKGLAYSGVCMIIVGTLNLLIYLLVDTCVSVINRSVSLGRDFWRQVILPVKTTSITMGIILVVAGVVFCLINILIKKIQNRMVKASA